MPQIGTAGVRRSQSPDRTVQTLGVPGSGQGGPVADRRDLQAGTQGPPPGGANRAARMPAYRPRALSRSNPAGQGPQAGEYPALGSPGDFAAERGGTLRYIRDWLTNVFTARHDPGQTFYNPAGLRTESGGKVSQAPISRRFNFDVWVRTFGQFAQSFPNGGYVRYPTGNRYYPWSLQLRAKQYAPWEDWSRTKQVAIYTTGVQPQQTTPWWPALTTQPPQSSFGAFTPVLPTNPETVYSEGTYG
jgi:hypothetical protein